MGDKKYSEIEIETARNALNAGFEWIARDAESETDFTMGLYTYRDKPKKDKVKNIWRTDKCDGESLTSYAPLFSQIQWEDEEPVRLRDIVPQRQNLTKEPIGRM